MSGIGQNLKSNHCELHNMFRENNGRRRIMTLRDCQMKE